MKASVSISGAAASKEKLLGLLEAGISSICVSLNGSTAKINDVTRQGFEEAIAALRWLKEIPDCVTLVNFVMHGSNAEDLPDLLRLLEILYELSLTENYHLLASKSFANVKNMPDNQRVRRVEEYIDAHFTSEIRLKTLADLAGMTPAAFSRYFRTQTGRTISDYIIELRLGHAARNLVDSTKSIAEICYECGFNNISNFNRIFKKKKGCAPSTFRDNYHKSKIII